MEISSASTSPIRRNSYDYHELPSVKPNKYKQIFEQQERLGSRGYSPNSRINDNNRQIKILRGKLSNDIQQSCFFAPGTQKNDDHFKKLIAEFIVYLRGADPLISDAARGLVSEFGRYKDVCITSPDKNRPTPELIAELQELILQKQGLQKDLIDVLKKNSQKLDPRTKTARLGDGSCPWGQCEIPTTSLFIW